MIGHNQGPSLEGGTQWRRTCWTKARKSLLPTLPIEVVRLRVKRAKEIGLDYTTYASVRAQTGHDVVALLFSSNALDMIRQNSPLNSAKAAHLTALKAVKKGALVQFQTHRETLKRQSPDTFATISQAPRPFAPWDECRRVIQSSLHAAKWPADRVVMVGDTSDERLWCDAARMAGYVPANRFFTQAAS